MLNRINAVYGRQSVDRKDSISIESQIEFCEYELKAIRHIPTKAILVRIQTVRSFNSLWLTFKKV